MFSENRAQQVMKLFGEKASKARQKGAEDTSNYCLGIAVGIGFAMEYNWKRIVEIVPGPEGELPTTH